MKIENHTPFNHFIKPVQHTRVLIIGGGATGTGLARDLALRGIPCILVEKQDINSGASGGNHGLLHSGARYVASDAEAAKECCEEGNLLKKLVGLGIFQTSVYLLYIAPGKLIGGTAPILDQAFKVYSSPLPHVLILTVIVVGVATLALGLAITYTSPAASNPEG